MRFFPKIYQSRLGESLIEVVIAVFIVAMGAGIATSLIVNALQANSFSGDTLVAVNLATEGLEAMRSIRDNNWLKYSFDRKNCWNLKPTALCDGPDYDVIGDGHYVVDLNQDYVWQLTFIDNDSPKNLNLEDLKNTINIPYELKVIFPKDAQSEMRLYVSREGLEQGIFPGTFNNTIDVDSPLNGRFYRMIQVNKSTADSMEITSVVQWRAQNAVHTVSLSSQLTNYQKEKS